MEGGEQVFLPHISLDCVIFGYEQNQVKVLLTEIQPQHWMLPGGYIKRTESLDEAAHRTLKERSGLENIFLKQFHTFGDRDREFSQEIEDFMRTYDPDLKAPKELWIAKRFISVGYYALVRIEDTKPQPGFFAGRFDWHPIRQLPHTVLDHGHIATKAFEFLCEDLTSKDVAHHLLPRKFTMPELHQLHESILNKKLDRSRFQKKMLALGIYERLPEMKEGVPHKRPYLYRFKY